MEGFVVGGRVVDGRIVDGSYFKDSKKNAEVLYPAIFDDTHPAHGHPAHPHPAHPHPATLMWDEGKDFTSVPIHHLSHITHNREAAQIEAAQMEAAVMEAAQMEAAEMEAAQMEASQMEAAQMEAAVIEASEIEAAVLEASQIEAAILENAIIEAAIIEAAQIETAVIEAAQIEAAVIEAAQIKASEIEDAVIEAAQIEADIIEAAQIEAAQIEAAQIEVGCKFKVSQKIGKAYEWDGSPIGETYRKVDENAYKEILRYCGSRVLPGYLSWWGISVEDWYSCTADGKRLKQIVEEVKESMAVVPDYLQTPACSCYGNNAFIMSLNHAMDCYKDSRKECASQSIYLKKAGTLRYRYEICYVILVCMEEDLWKDAELRDMPSMHGEPIFEHNGYINEYGMIINPSAVPVFNTKHVVKKKGTTYSWENIAFAFYFDKEGKYFLGRDVRKSSMMHDKSACISTQPRQPRVFGEKWVCPNEITD